VKLYTSLFKNSRIKDTQRYGEGAPGGIKPGTVMTVDFELDGVPFVALSGGDSFSFAEGISLSVSAEDQAEIDRLTDGLIAGGGTEGPCGWVTDRFGVAWQINPPILGQLLTDKDPEKAGRAMQAMLGMKRINIADLKRAFEGKTPAKV
jgi:predicted 3-demethylubiquinone-9 3-methyltransferase (glyoxalase superfamily)